MASQIPDKTISALARSIFQETRSYGFGQIDTVRLINALMDLSVEGAPRHADREPGAATQVSSIDDAALDVSGFPLSAKRLQIHRLDPERDLALLESWLQDEQGQHFLLSCATAQRTDLGSLLANSDNHLGMIMLTDGQPIGAVAFLDHDRAQRRAELRKVIGVAAARGKGYAQEATVLWLKYGVEVLKLEKVYVSTLQNHMRNIRLNEGVGFRVEGVLADEVLIDGQRMDVLRMGFCRCRPQPEDL